MRRLSAVLASVIVIVGCTATTPQHFMTIGEQRLAVEIAQTPAERERGLSGRPSLPENTGLLFLFDEPQLPAFWMKDMQFPIDIIWIANDRVAGITANIPVPTTTVLERYYPPEPVTKVLEVNAGWAERIGVTIGAPIVFDTAQSAE